MKDVYLKLIGSKRVAALTLAMVLLLGIGSADAEFEATDPTGDAVAADASPSPDPSSTPEESPSPEGITPPGGGGGNVNNEVVVINTVDSRSAHRAGVGVARVTGREAHNQNAAAATSSCNDCRTVAVAAQAVLIQRTDASDISPRNFAIAINADCVRCETFAAAYQLVFTTDGLVRLTDGAQQQLAAYEGKIRAIAGDEDLSFPEMEAKIDGLVAQMWSLVKSELAAVGIQGSSKPLKDTDEATTGGESPSPSPSVSESPSESPSPTDSATPDPEGSDVGSSPEPTETATPANEPEATPSPSPT